MPCKTQMYRRALLAILTLLTLTGCDLLWDPDPALARETVPVATMEIRPQPTPELFVDLADFQQALLLTLAARDTTRLQGWMSEPFLVGTWRQEQHGVPAAEALETLRVQIAPQNSLEVVPEADLPALLGGVDPLTLPGADAGVSEVLLVSGWGADGRDEALLFITRQSDRSLRWLGWLRIAGGISGARTGGMQAYQNEDLGFSLYAPQTFSVGQPAENYVVILGPGGGGHPGGAFIQVEAADGRTSKQVVEQVITQTKAEMGEGWIVPTPLLLHIEQAQAYVISGMPGQDVNRQLFMVRGDQLFHITFMPESPQSGDAYWQMEEAYASLVNTFHFLP